MAQILFRCIVISVVLFAGSFCLFSADYPDDYYSDLQDKETSTNTSGIKNLEIKNTELMQSKIALEKKVVELEAEFIHLDREKNERNQKIEELQKILGMKQSESITIDKQLIRERTTNEQVKKERTSLSNRNMFNLDSMKSFAIRELKNMTNASNCMCRNFSNEVSTSKVLNYASERCREIMSSTYPPKAPAKNKWGDWGQV
jgi:hypothetical protein